MKTMADLPNPTEIASLASLLAPGLIISTIRTRAITGSIPDIKDRLVSYALISTAYFAVVTPLFQVAGGVTVPLWLASVLQNFLLPVAVGIAMAYIYQWRWSYRLAERVGLHLAHHIPAAWDYVFEALPAGTFVLVTLTDGTQIAGKMSKDSFSSSSKDERDLFIEEVWETGKKGQPWTPLNPPRAILLCGKDIKLVEIY
jgi:Family of unknown function (DUF6338)